MPGILSQRNPVARMLGMYLYRWAIRRVLQQAYIPFARRYPQWAASLFDEHFLVHRVAPLLLVPDSGQVPLSAATIAGAWAAQLGTSGAPRQKQNVEATPVAAEFLRLLKHELSHAAFALAVFKEPVQVAA